MHFSTKTFALVVLAYALATTQVVGAEAFPRSLRKVVKKDNKSENVRKVDIVGESGEVAKVRKRGNQGKDGDRWKMRNHKKRKARKNERKKNPVVETPSPTEALAPFVSPSSMPSSAPSSTPSAPSTSSKPTSAPSASSMPSSTPSASSMRSIACVDDFTFEIQGRRGRNCWYLMNQNKERTRKECLSWAHASQEYSNKVYEYCRATCYAVGIEEACSSSTAMPSQSPSASSMPSQSPSTSSMPSSAPSTSSKPSSAPSASSKPSSAPSASSMPSSAPSASSMPSLAPSASSMPSSAPSASSMPSSTPSASSMPSFAPSEMPSASFMPSRHPVYNCVDDANFLYMGIAGATCADSVQQNTDRRTRKICNKRANADTEDPRAVYEYCKATCYAAGVDRACSSSTAMPSQSPSTSLKPSSAPSGSSMPSSTPSAMPSSNPSSAPSTSMPSSTPSAMPSLIPSSAPSASSNPSSTPSAMPSSNPSSAPSASSNPSSAPSASSMPSIASTFESFSVVGDEGVWADPFAHFPVDLPAKKPRIVNGDRSNPSETSFFARAGYDEYFYTSEIMCGSALIWSDILITAAHCQGAFNHGALILDPNTNDFTRLVPIDRQVRHPGWSISRQQLNYDVLVMRLATPLSSDDVAKPIPINKDSFYPSKMQPLRAYGYGVTEAHVVSEYLREAEVTYISNDDCWDGISFNNVLKSEEVMCTDPYDDRTATCLGDSGGPLTDSSRSTLVGVISFGSGCEADHIPDGHVRISQVHDWIQDQICLLSANPPDSCSGNKEPFDPEAVEVVIDFTHDFYPEHTTFTIKNKKTQENVYSGPEYMPTRNGNHRESVFLPPGDYTFDVYDVHGNGLMSDKGDGSWKVLALYDDITETELATGGADFRNQQVTKFVVGERTVPRDTNDTEDTAPDNNVGVAISEQLLKCLDAKDAELATEEMFSATCTCVSSPESEDIVLACFHDSGESCPYRYQTCTTSDECCGELTCELGKCGRESRASVVSLGRDRNRISGTSVGGASERGGNLRRK